MIPLIMRTFSLLLLGFAMVGNLGEVAHSETTLYRRLEGEPTTLNPILQSSELEETVIDNVSRNLLDAGPHLDLVGGLCDHWEVSENLTRYRFHLREEAVWENGLPVTAHDAAITLRRIVDPLVPALRFASGFAGLVAVDEIDSKTFEVHFATPYAMRLNSFRIPLLPAASYEHGDLLRNPQNRGPLANGPYRVASWLAGEKIVLVRNERYWGQRAAFDRVVFRLLPNQAQAYRALVRGELDETRLSSEQARDALSDPSFRRCCRVNEFFDLSFLYLGYNNKHPEFGDAATRRALTMLLDRQGIVEHVFGGAGAVLSGPWPKALPTYDARVVSYAFDPQRAQTLLKGAGWHQETGGLERKGAPFRFHLLYAASSNSSREIAEIAQASFAKAGIECVPQSMEWAALTKRVEEGDFDAVVLSWANDLNPDLFEAWHSSQVPPHGMNSLSYANPAVDRLIEATRREPNEAKRLELFHQLHAVLHDDEPATWLCQIAVHHALNRRIQGVTVTPLGLFRFWPGATVWFSKN